MKNRILSLLLVLSVTACGSINGPIDATREYVPAIHTLRAISASSYRLLYNFDAPTTVGFNPNAFVDVNGTLYGTTGEGGPKTFGTIYKFPLGGGKPTVLYSFWAWHLGNPDAGLTSSGGTLYGATSGNCGSVFSITAAGRFTLLHSFHVTDGCSPTAAPILVGATLYGTTSMGGKFVTPGHGSSGGTVYRIDRDGRNFRVLYNFHSPDGTVPNAELIYLNGTLYGTTTNGGTKGKANWRGGGTIFSITPGGSEKTLYTFPSYPYSGSPGFSPYAPLTNVNGMLYGTTQNGGLYGLGTFFSVTTSGKLKVLYSFGKPGDGGVPRGRVIYSKGAFYGVTIGGGSCNLSSSSTSAGGCGTVFKITTTGRETVLHSFAGAPTDGNSPVSLIKLGGTLYGATAFGGSDDGGALFALTP